MFHRASQEILDTLRSPQPVTATRRQYTPQWTTPPTYGGISQFSKNFWVKNTP
nr:MAG TPA: hypothetical protein [Caudoviricetes sp.]